jgi:hypothetical protein
VSNFSGHRRSYRLHGNVRQNCCCELHLFEKDAGWKRSGGENEGRFVALHLAANNGVADMNTHAVKLQVEAKVPKQCIFWLEADGWTGICQELSITVQGSSFEGVKRTMEAALREHIETVLRENPKASTQQAA